MKQSLCLALRVLTPVTCNKAGVPFTTSLGRIIETRAMISGGAPSWPNNRRDIREGVREGKIVQLPPPAHHGRYDPFRSPVVLAWTNKGLSDFETPDIEDRPCEELEPQLHLVPRQMDGPPAWLPKRKPSAHNLPPKPKAIMDVLQGLQDCSRRHYIQPSVEWILKQCEKFHREPMAASSFFAWAAWLEWCGFLRRATRKRQLEVDTWSKGKLLKAGAWINDTTLYYIAAKAWGWAKRAYDRSKKHFSHTELQDPGHYIPPFIGSIGREEASTDSSPPFLRIKGAAEAAGRFSDHLRPIGSILKSLIPSSARQ